MARTKSILTEAKQIERAVTLIQPGRDCRCWSPTDLSYERLLRLYKEVSGKSSEEGPAAVPDRLVHDTAVPNIHASLFLEHPGYLNKVAEMDEIDDASSRPTSSTQEQISAQAWSRCCR